MMNIAGLGRLAAATVLLSGLAFGSAVNAQEVSEEQLKASRAAIDAIGATAQFDNILPGLAERLKAYPDPGFAELPGHHFVDGRRAGAGVGAAPR